MEDQLGVPSDRQLLQRQAAREAGLSYSDEKAVEGELIVERMGALVDGEVGRVSVPDKVLSNIVNFAFWVLSCSWIFWRTWLMLLGRRSRVFKFRRPLSSTLNRVWKFLGTEGGRPPNREVRAEILLALSCLHLAFTDFRADISREAVCLDASMSGGGACVSTGLSDEGTAALSEDASFKPHAKWMLRSGC